MIEGNSTIKISEVLNGEVVKIAGLEKIAENPEKFPKIKRYPECLCLKINHYIIFYVNRISGPIPIEMPKGNI